MSDKLRRLLAVSCAALVACLVLPLRAGAFPPEKPYDPRPLMAAVEKRLTEDKFSFIVMGDVKGSRAQIIRVAVDPDHQGEGFGRYLLADALDFARRSDAETISLNTQWNNKTSQRLYQGFGFRTVGRRIPVLIKELVRK